MTAGAETAGTTAVTAAGAATAGVGTVGDAGGINARGADACTHLELIDEARAKVAAERAAERVQGDSGLSVGQAPRAEPPGDGHGGDGRRADVASYSVPRDKLALNEFTANANILYGSFWHHFPLAMGLVRVGSLLDGDSRHLMTQFHNGFAQNANFNFLLADQKRRHAACRGVSRRIKSNKASYEAFIKKVAAGEAYVQELQEARNDPFSKKARALLKEITSFVTIAGAHVPWSAHERKAELTKLYALTRRFGPASCFLSVAPDDVHHPTVLRLCYKSGEADNFPAVPAELLELLRRAEARPKRRSVPADERTESDERDDESNDELDAAVRAFNERVKEAGVLPNEEYEFQLNEAFQQKLAALKPVATTLFFEQLSEAIFTHLIGMPPTGKRKATARAATRARGVLGRCFAWASVIETNKRKSLHFHASIYGGAAPALLANVAGHPELEALVMQALDSMYSAEADLDLHALDVARKQLNVRMVRHSFLEAGTFSCDCEPAAGSACSATCSRSRFLRGAAASAMSTGLHQIKPHKATCFCGAQGKCGCRMARPAGHAIEATRVLEIQHQAPGEAPPGNGRSGDAVPWRCPHESCDCAPERDAARGLHVRALKPVAGEAEDGTLSYELRRRSLTEQSDSDCPTLLKLLGLGKEAAEELLTSDDDCQAMAAAICAELVQSVYLSEFSVDLGAGLVGERSPAVSRALLGAWRSMHCRNAVLIEYTPVMTGLVRSNTAPLLLGAGHSAKAAGMYMTKYMVKEAYELAASLTVMIDARRHIEKYPSVADDSGETTRTTTHFLQRVLNTAAAELSPTQAAGMNLGLSSSSHSHSFANVYVWDAVRLARIGRAGGALLADEDEEGADDGGVGAAEGAEGEGGAEGEAGQGDEEGGAHAGAGEEAELDDEGVDLGEEVGRGRHGTSAVYTNAEGVKTVVSQAEHYAWRSCKLRSMCFIEFVMGLKVVKLAPAERDAVKAAMGGAGSVLAGL